jgi:hypothetical protein
MFKRCELNFNTRTNKIAVPIFKAKREKGGGGGEEKWRK